MEPVFAWFGGKALLVPKLLKLVPSHRLYVEVFGGAASLLLAKEPAAVEVYNDIDGNLVNFFRVVRDPQKLEQLALMLELTPYSRLEHAESKRALSSADAISALSDVERAYYFFYNIRCSFSGLVGGSFAYSKVHSRRAMSSKVSSYLSAIDGLFELHTRLRTVQIEWLDWRDCLSRYEHPEGFFYLDPPYHPDLRCYPVYECEMSAEDHEELVDSLLGFSGKVLLSGYDHPVYRRLVDAGWKRLEFQVLTSCRISRGEGSVLSNPQRSRVEVVWFNYDPEVKYDVDSSGQAVLVEVA